MTGLAALGSPDKTLPIMDKMMTMRDGRIFSNLGDWFTPFPDNISEILREALDGFGKDDVAAGLQCHVENLVASFVTEKLKAYPHQNICLAGGLFANVKLNQRILEIDGIENIYIQPHMGDGGLALGGAIMANYTHTGAVNLDMPNAYLGPSFSNTEIEIQLKRAKGIQYYCASDRVKDVCEIIQSDRVVGYFDGRMEFGPRALGHRSILYHPSDRTVNNWLNARMKRTEFMPFAPIVPIEVAERCFKGWRPDHVAATFMTITYECTDWFAELCPAVTHVDRTARPQIVSKELDPVVHAILTEFYEQTGIPSLINTSFNNHEDPIVHKPEDAIEVLLSGSVDALAIGCFIVERI